MIEQLTLEKKRGCPTCGGLDAKSCMRCYGKTRMCDWYNTVTGWTHVPTIELDDKIVKELFNDTDT